MAKRLYYWLVRDQARCLGYKPSGSVQFGKAGLVVAEYKRWLCGCCGSKWVSECLFFAQALEVKCRSVSSYVQ